MAQTITVDQQSEICFLEPSKCVEALGRDTLLRFVNSPYSHGGLAGLTFVSDGTADGIQPVPGADQMSSADVTVNSCQPAGTPRTPQNEIFRILDDPVNVCG